MFTYFKNKRLLPVFEIVFFNAVDVTKTTRLKACMAQRIRVIFYVVKGTQLQICP